MFGYIVIHEPELRMREISLYRSYYCGLCEDLLENYGRAGQLVLSYDTSFLGLLLTSLYEPEDTRETQTVCLTHPFRMHAMRRNRYTRYAADITILLAWYASRDDWADERRPRGLAVSGLLRGAFRRACARLPEKAAVIRTCLDRLHRIETEHPCRARDAGPDGLSPSGIPGADVSAADEAGACFGELMAEIFVCTEDAWAETLRRMGFYLGKYIYLLDAYDDLEKDRKSGSFNPLLPVRDRMEAGGEDFDGYVRSLLTMLMASCTRAFEMLPIVENVDILRNILYAGVWTRFEQIYAGRAQADTSPDDTQDASQDTSTEAADAAEVSGPMV